MTGTFPTHLKSNNIGDIGVNAVSQIVNDELKYIFKRNSSEYDFGIDAYIEIVTDNGSVTGQVIGVQIKCGSSFFKVKSKTGFTFYGENKHLNYYCNAPFPIIIVICDPDTRECFWQKFSIESTEKTDSNWKINIPKRNRLSLKSKDQLAEIVGEPVDYSSQAQAQWEMTEAFKSADSILYSVARKDIESGNVKPLHDFFNRILSNDDLAINLQGKVVVSIDGYTLDKRELWEIREVRRWAKKAEPKIKYWFFFCANLKNSSTLIWLFTCLTKIISVKPSPLGGSQLRITYETKPLSEVIMRNFMYLNELTNRYGISVEENQRISYEAMESIGLDFLNEEEC